RRAAQLGGAVAPLRGCSGTLSGSARRTGGDRARKESMETVDGRITPRSEQMTAPMGAHPPVQGLRTPRKLPWLTPTQVLNGSGENRCGKFKSAYLRKPFSKAQIETMWACMGKEHYTDYVNKEALIQID